ncbi:MAG TPA: mannosyltransferase family protein [Pyrinomonadaceae bacterium]|nr:mannosyltransferase family protein [Pyrinomonadaceae bacterium]
MKKNRQRRAGRESAATASTASSSAGERAGARFDWRRIDWETVALVVAIKLLVMVFAGVAYAVLENKTTGGLYGWLAIWNRWDAPHYLDIARDGYVTEGEARKWIVFYPLYPLATRVLSYVFQDYLLSALVVSALASIAAALLLQRLVEIDFDRTIARAAVWFMFIFPTSYFFHTSYTESLFMAIALGAFLAARGRRWWVAGLLAALACMTRVNGLMLVPALAVEAFLQYREDPARGLRAEWLWIALAGVGVAIYLSVNYAVHGDPFAFQKITQAAWHKQLAPPWEGIAAAWDAGWRAPAEAHMVGVEEFFFILLGLACTVWCWLTLRASYAVWMTFNWLLWTSTSFILSTPRYTLILFPIYILFARLAARRPVWGGVITAWSLLFLALFTGLFVRGHWAF